MNRFQPSDSSETKVSGTETSETGASGASGASGAHPYGVDFSEKIRRNAWLESRRRFFVPIHHQPSYAYPLIVWLHNDGFNENQVDQIMPHISVRNYLAVGIRGSRAVDARGTCFEWSSSTAGIGMAHDRVATAMEEAEKRFSIHQRRIILAGYGSGGTMAMRIAMRDPQRFAAVVSLGGVMPKHSITDLGGMRRRRLPMLWQWACENDRYTQQQLSQDCKMAMSIGSPVEVRQYPGRDEMDTVVLSDLNDWVMQTVVSGSCQTHDPSSFSFSNSSRTSPVDYSIN